jgi:hypothetical protein
VYGLGVGAVVIAAERVAARRFELVEHAAQLEEERRACTVALELLASAGVRAGTVDRDGETRGRTLQVGAVARAFGWDPDSERDYAAAVNEAARLRARRRAIIAELEIVAAEVKAPEREPLRPIPYVANVGGRSTPAAPVPQPTAAALCPPEPPAAPPEPPLPPSPRRRAYRARRRAPRPYRRPTPRAARPREICPAAGRFGAAALRLAVALAVVGLALFRLGAMLATVLAVHAARLIDWAAVAAFNIATTREASARTHSDARTVGVRL